MKPPHVPCPPRNPHCQGLDSVLIDNWIWVIIAIIAITAYLIINKKFIECQTAKKQT